MSARASVYFDWNATSPPAPSVVEVMQEVRSSSWANPASVHQSGRRARALVDAAKERIAEAFEARGSQLAFTSGGSEANNLALWDVPALVTSRLEHPSVVSIAERLELQGVPVSWLSVGPSGAIEPREVATSLSALPQGAWVSVMACNHETGVIQPIVEVAAAVRNAGGRLHVDAVQWVGKGPLDVLRVAHRLSVAPHKFRGPKGIGGLLWQPGSAPSPLLVGGGQQSGLRPGTEDASLAAGFAEAVRRSNPATYGRLADLRDRLEQELGQLGVVNGQAPRLPHVSNLSFHGARGDELVPAADLMGVEVSSGSACSAGTQERSPVIEAMVGRERSESSVRFSMGETTTTREVERAIEVFKTLLTADHRIPSGIRS